MVDNADNPDGSAIVVIEDMMPLVSEIAHRGSNAREDRPGLWKFSKARQRSIDTFNVFLCDLQAKPNGALDMKFEEKDAVTAHLTPRPNLPSNIHRMVQYPGDHTAGAIHCISARLALAAWCKIRTTVTVSPSKS